MGDWFPLFLPLSSVPSVLSCFIPCQPSRALPLRYYCHLRSSTSPNYLSCFNQSVPPSHPLLFPARDPLSPCISHHAPSLTLSPRSSAKTSIRLSPVAPRYTESTRASRRVLRVPKGNNVALYVSLVSLAVTTMSHKSVARHVLPARDSQYVTT